MIADGPLLTQRFRQIVLAQVYLCSMTPKHGPFMTHMSTNTRRFPEMLRAIQTAGRPKIVLPI